jgi:phage terminase small subunit
LHAPLTAQRERFCLEMLIDDNGAAAARRAGYSARRAKQMANELLAMPAIQARLAELRAERKKRLELEADDVLRELWTMAKADPRELIEYRVGACRYCHGTSHLYQRTPRERAEAFAEWEKKKEPPTFDELGGVGYNRNAAPHPDCPECNGLGEGFTIVKDQRNVSPAAARLLAGVKETKEGIEVKMHDPQAALVSVGKHLGMFTDKVDHTTNGQPLPPSAIVVTLVKPQG